jgi:serine/threonine protein kinase
MMSSLRSLRERQVAQIMKQILSAVHYCHQRHIMHRYSRALLLHRDLKLENVLLTERDVQSTIKVIDFGRSKILRSLVHPAENVGSVLFILI